MKKLTLLIFPLVFLFVQCDFISGKKQKEEPVPKPVVKTAKELFAEEKAREDSIENAEFEKMQKTAFGDVMFGMIKDSVFNLNEERQHLGKYDYNFSYSFNNEDKLYKLKLTSGAVRAIQFDSDLNNRYQNLFRIIQTKYGEPLSQKEYPSIFDVQNNKKYQISKWEKGTKQISVGVQETGKNSYSAFCEILDKNMTEAELERQKNLKNKDIIEASSKF